MAIALGLTLTGAITDLLGIDATINVPVNILIPGGPAPFTIFGGNTTDTELNLSPLLDSVPGGANDVVASLGAYVGIGHPSLVGPLVSASSGGPVADFLDNTTLLLSDILGPKQ